MEGAFGSHRRRKRPVINITSLIDVMFILLIFLMVTTTFREHLGIDVTLPAADDASPQELTPHEITVDANGILHLGEQRVSESELRESLVELLGREPDATLVLRADESADFGHVVRAIDIAQAVGGNRLIIPTHPAAGQPPPAAD